jgi:hypothetical protein
VLALAGGKLLIVAPTIAFEEAAQGQRVIGVGQPEQSDDVQLLDPLAGEAQSLADGGQALGRTPRQAVVGDDDLAQAWRQRTDEAMEFGPNLGLVELLGRVGEFDSWDYQAVR